MFNAKPARTPAIGLSMAVFICLMLPGFTGANQPISLEPDFYSAGTVLPTNLGVRLSLGNLADNALVALEPQGNYGIAPSAGNHLYGWKTTISYTDFDYYRNFEAVFDDTTSFVAIDVLWPREASPGFIGYSKGGQLLAYDTANTLVYNKVLPPGLGGTHDRISVYRPGIKRVILRPYDPYSGGSSPNYIGSDNFTFAGIGGLSLKLDAENPVDAPSGMKLSSDDSLSGNGRVNGDVDNQGGTVSPGESAGEITTAGAFSQGPDGATILDVGQLASDKLTIEGAADFGGVLELLSPDGLNLVEGDSLDLITYASLGMGRFHEIRGLEHLGYPDVVYGDLALSLVGTRIPEPTSIWLALCGALSLGVVGKRRHVANAAINRRTSS